MTKNGSTKIEKGVPLPNTRRSVLYPFEDMKIGDSFSHKATSPSAIYNLAKQASYRLSPMKFRGGKDSTGALRIWRIA